MTFSNILNEYMAKLNISAKYLCEATGISKASISRFRASTREPKEGSAVVYAIAKAISEHTDCCESAEEIAQKMNSALEKTDFDFGNMTTKLNVLMQMLDINANDMSRYLKYDPSYLSRIRSGKRQPADPTEFCRSIAEFVSRHYFAKHSDTIADIINHNATDIENEVACKNAVVEWLTDNSVTIGNNIGQFLGQLDRFDINEVMQRTGKYDGATDITDKIEIKSETSEYYYNTEGSKTAQLKMISAVLSGKDTSEMFYYSDMPFEKQAKDNDFAAKWTAGIAAILKKGVRINIIHNVDRSLHEMILGLKGWIPMYMTGLVAPYYLNDMHDPVFNHMLTVCNNAALQGEGVSSGGSNARFHFTTKSQEVRYYKKRSEDMLAKASPLMEIYTYKNAEQYGDLLKAHFGNGNATLHNINTAPPIYTMSDDLLCRIMDRYDIPSEKRKMICDYAKRYREATAIQLKNGVKIYDELAIMPKEEFDTTPVPMPLHDIFADKRIEYNYGEYCEHIELTKKYSEQNEGHQIHISNGESFRNIQIRIAEGEYVIISKSTAPTIHFVIRHNKLRRAIEHLTLPEN